MVEDVTPQLGGNLDGQTWTITAEGITSTVPDNANKVALIINQNDVTNDPRAVVITNNSDDNALQIDQDAVLSAANYALYLSSNVAQINAGLAWFRMDNAGSTQNVLRITNDGSGSGIYFDNNGTGQGLEFNNDSPNNGIYISQGIESDASKHALYVSSTLEQDNSPLVRFNQNDPLTSAGVFHIDNTGIGDSFFIDQGGNGTAFEIDSEAANATGVDWDFQNDSNNLFQMSVNSVEKFAIEWTGAVTFANAYTFPVVDGALNEVLTTDGAGGVTWQAGGGGGGDLDDAYELGSTVTVDVANVIWDLTSTQDFIIKDNGATKHTWDDDGKYNYTVNATNYQWLYSSGTNTRDGALGAPHLNAFGIIHDAGNSTTLSGLTASTVINSVENSSYGSAFFKTLLNYGLELYATADVDYSANNYSNNLFVEGLFGAASNSGDFASTHDGGLGTTRNIRGLEFSAAQTGNVNISGTQALTDTIHGILVSANNNAMTYTQGTYSSTLYGAHLSANGNVAGTSKAYGIYATASGADDNYAAWFYRNVADTAPVVLIEQDNASGLGAVIELQQDDASEPFIDFTGTVAAAIQYPSSGRVSNFYWTHRILVEINGSDYYIYAVQ